jgi:hypothetical protein
VLPVVYSKSLIWSLFCGSKLSIYHEHMWKCVSRGVLKKLETCLLGGSKPSICQEQINKGLSNMMLDN